MYCTHVASLEGQRGLIAPGWHHLGGDTWWKLKKCRPHQAALARGRQIGENCKKKLRLKVYKRYWKKWCEGWEWWRWVKKVISFLWLKQKGVRFFEKKARHHQLPHRVTSTLVTPLLYTDNTPRRQRRPNAEEDDERTMGVLQLSETLLYP